MAACEIPTPKELAKVEEIYNTYVPKGVRAVLDPKRTRSGAIYGYRGRRQHGGATLLQHVLTTIIVLGAAGVSVGVIVYFLGPELLSQLSGVRLCAGAGEQFMGLVMGLASADASCGARQARLDSIVAQARVSIVGSGVTGASLAYNSVLAWVERITACSAATATATSASAGGGASASSGGGGAPPSAGGGGASASSGGGGATRKSRKRNSGLRRRKTARHRR